MTHARPGIAGGEGGGAGAAGGSSQPSQPGVQVGPRRPPEEVEGGLRRRSVWRLVRPARSARSTRRWRSRRSASARSTRSPRPLRPRTRRPRSRARSRAPRRAPTQARPAHRTPPSPRRSRRGAARRGGPGSPRPRSGASRRPRARALRAPTSPRGAGRARRRSPLARTLRRAKELIAQRRVGVARGADPGGGRAARVELSLYRFLDDVRQSPARPRADRLDPYDERARGLERAASAASRSLAVEEPCQRRLVTVRSSPRAWSSLGEAIGRMESDIQRHLASAYAKRGPLPSCGSAARNRRRISPRAER